MDILCGYHAKDPEICKWVIDNCDGNTDNITVQNWVKASKEYLQSLGSWSDQNSSAVESQD